MAETQFTQDTVPLVEKDGTGGHRPYVQSPQLPTTLAAGGGMKVEGVAGGVAQPVSLSALPALAAGSAIIGKVQPFAAMIEAGLTEVIDKDDTEVSQNDYSKSVAVALGGTYSGEITSVLLVASELGTGAVPARAGILYFFDADPTVSSGDTALALADWQSLIGKQVVGDWSSDANGGAVFEPVSIPFHALSTIYVVFQNLGAAINDAAGDDEELHLNFWYRRES